MKKLMAFAILLLAPVASVSAGALDLSLGDDSANIVYLFSEDPLNRKRRAQDGGSELALGVFFNEPGTSLVHTTLLARGYRGNAQSRYQLSAGVRIVGGDINVDEELGIENSEEESVMALALGFQTGLLVRSAGRNYNPMDITFEGFYAPSISSFSDAENYFEAALRLQIEIMTRARAYIGFRRISFETVNHDELLLDDNTHIGLSISF